MTPSSPPVILSKGGLQVYTVFTTMHFNNIANCDTDNMLVIFTFSALTEAFTREICATL